MTGDSELVRVAARNNAELCDLVARARGVGGVFAADAWTAARRTPPLYPDAVTLVPGVDTRGLLDRIDTSSGASVKDSFSSLDLRAHGFVVLFDAEWIHRPPGDADPGNSEWSAHERGQGLVDLRGTVDAEVVGTAVVNRSGDVVGVSNLDAASDDLLAGVWSGVVHAIADRFPGLGVVGYESGAMLDAARAVGFRPIGPLRIWIKD